MLKVFVKQLAHISLIILLFSAFNACSVQEDNKQPQVFKQLPEIKEIKPQKPARIKLKRDTKGEYSWEISGDNADEVIKTDKKLKESLGK